jgi:phosphoenolpyruvate carboxykinase (ATP)
MLRSFNSPTIARNAIKRAFSGVPLGPEGLKKFGIESRSIYRNLSVPKYYELSITGNPSHPTTSPSCLSSTGAYVAYSGEKSGRSPKDKRIVEPDTASEKDKIWWGSVNQMLPRETYTRVLQRAQDYLSTKDHLFVVDGWIGWDPKYRKAVRIICTRPYHALFMHNMLVRPTPEELRTSFHQPEFVVYNAGEFSANIGTTSRA